MNTTCIYCTPEQFKTVSGMFEKDQLVMYPENGLLFEDIRLLPRMEGKVVVTTNPLVCTNYKQREVYTVGAFGLDEVYDNLYGACFTIAAKALDMRTRALINQHVVDEMRVKLKESDDAAIEYLNTIGDSMEKAYLLRKLDKKSGQGE